MTTAIESAGLTFLCDDPIEEWRAKTLLEKEPGTIAWINQMQPGEVFYDIGANIGVYTLYAAKRGVKVYAFEPHALNAVELARNVHVNGLSDLVTVIQMPITEGYGLALFYYRSLRAGTSGHQSKCEWENNCVRFEPECCIRMPSSSIDGLLEWDEIKAPHYIKIDVDGNEPKIVDGLRCTLVRSTVKSLQIETEPEHRAEVDRELEKHGYPLSYRHYTQAGQRKIDLGADPETVICNSVYVRA